MILERVQTPRGELALRQVGEHFEIVSNGVFLMDTRDGHSERLLATAALAAHEVPRHVLIGGLGVGFTLAAALADARVSSVTVIEVEPTIWLRRKRRTTSSASTLTTGRTGQSFNGNGRLYNAAGASLLRGRLRSGGVLAIWSSRAVPKYEDLLRSQFGELVVHDVPTDHGEPDVVYVAVC